MREGNSGQYRHRAWEGVCGAKAEEITFPRSFLTRISRTKCVYLSSLRASHILFYAKFLSSYRGCSCARRRLSLVAELPKCAGHGHAHAFSHYSHADTDSYAAYSDPPA